MTNENHYHDCGKIARGYEVYYNGFQKRWECDGTTQEEGISSFLYCPWCGICLE